MQRFMNHPSLADSTGGSVGHQRVVLRRGSMVRTTCKPQICKLYVKVSHSSGSKLTVHVASIGHADCAAQRRATQGSLGTAPG